MTLPLEQFLEQVEYLATLHEWKTILAELNGSGQRPTCTRMYGACKLVNPDEFDRIVEELATVDYCKPNQLVTACSQSRKLLKQSAVAALPPAPEEDPRIPEAKAFARFHLRWSLARRRGAALPKLTEPTNTYGYSYQEGAQEFYQLIASHFGKWTAVPDPFTPDGIKLLLPLVHQIFGEVEAENLPINNLGFMEF